MVSYFLSDIHLKSLDEKSSRLLLLFLEETWAQEPGDIYLLGDIFDIWVSNHSFFKKKYKPLIDQFRTVKDKGFRVVYFEGNHDLHLKRFWKDELGFEVYFDVEYFSIDALVFRLEHGDLINLEDQAYQRLRRVLRTDWMLMLGYWLPGRFWNWFGEKWSHTSRRMSDVYQEDRKNAILNMIRNHAQKAVDEKYFDVIVTGHMHIKDDFTFQSKNGKSVRSINLGSWLDVPKILKYKDGTFTWIDPVSATETRPQNS
ncbi:MAG: UDP-2,3-diacylglucosamine diphosphatase [Bdellovibrionaceae bacterium]|nr:UDP-2,3-diacylglucosamine diphosphatase [Pseudobdellovibrionaceae bacterium]